ncbi:uncharacterized protein ISCGN_025213 [Ixodes scapularis]
MAEPLALKAALSVRHIRPDTALKLKFGTTMFPAIRMVRLNSTAPSVYTQELAEMVFGNETLGRCCLRGSTAGKEAMDKNTVDDIIVHVLTKFSNLSESDVRGFLRRKCNNAATALKKNGDLQENIGNRVMVPATLLATINKTYGSQPNKFARHMVRIVFTVEERRGKSLNEKACNARKDIPVKQCIDREKMNAIITDFAATTSMIRASTEQEPEPGCEAAQSRRSSTSQNTCKRKNYGGLTKPSPSTTYICQLAERVVRQQEKVDGGSFPKKGMTADTLTARVMRELSGQLNMLYPELHEHMFQSAVDSNHFVRLVKCVIGCYIKIRMHHAAKRATMKIAGPNMRKRLTKLILFNYQ